MKVAVSVLVLALSISFSRAQHRQDVRCHILASVTQDDLVLSRHRCHRDGTSDLVWAQ